MKDNVIYLFQSEEDHQKNIKKIENILEFLENTSKLLRHQFEEDEDNEHTPLT